MVFSAIFSFLFQGLSGTGLVFLVLMALLVVFSTRFVMPPPTTKMKEKERQQDSQQPQPQSVEEHRQDEHQQQIPKESKRQELLLSLPQEMIEALALCDRDDSELDSLSSTSSYTSSSTPSSPLSLSPSTSLTQLDGEFLEKQNKEVAEDVEWTLNAIEQKVNNGVI